MNLRAMFGLPAREVPGASPNPINPIAHLTGQAPAVMAEVEWTGADYDTIASRPDPPRAVRAWRLGSTGDAAPTNTDVAETDPANARAGVHLSRGEADTRRAEADRSAGPTPAYAPSPEDRRNVREDVRMNPEPPPSRPRQGFTGADPTRAARFPVAFTLRPFDKGIADHPGIVTKAGQPNPTASRPPTRTRLIGGRPSAAGSAGTGMEPVGPQPNTVRQDPPAWDTRLVNPGATTAPTSARGRSWRLA